MNLNVQTILCDAEQLESFLAGALSELQERDFTLHLSSCENCRRSLQERAAEPEAWQEAERLLRPADFELETESPSQSQPLQIQNVLAALGPTDDPAMLGRLGGYEVSGVVGAGGMGVVLKAIDKSLDRTVAIKVLTPHLATSGAARKRFAREAKAAAAVLHPNVIAIHSVSNEQSLPYLVMPYVRGTSLQKRLDVEGPLSLQEVLRIGSQVAAGLAAAHAQGLVHRDIKPANILLEEGVERVTITDFGLARAVDDASITHSGTIAGTPQYMSPEQARGEAVDGRSDLFSLGSVLYAICTGRPPFRAETSYGVLRRITDDEPTPIREINPDIPAWLCSIITRLMSKRADERLKTAAEVSELFEKCLAHVQQPATVPLPESLATKPKRVRLPKLSRLSLGAIAMIAAFGLGLLGMFLWQASEAPEIAGKWTGEGWGDVVLEKKEPGEYEGTYTDTFKKKPGTMAVKWSRLEGRFNGTWHEGQDRHGKISLRLVDNEIRGAWTTSKKSQINPGRPDLADLLWKRGGDRTPTTTAAPPAKDVQVQFASPAKMGVGVPDERGQFDKSPQFEVPSKLNLAPGKIYRLKLTNIEGREGTEVFPTLEVGPTTPRTDAFLAHNAIPIQFTEEDFDQVLAGNFVTKVMYLPDPEFQKIGPASLETLVSTRLDPGKDPILEADRRGSILAVIRLGNKDVEVSLQWLAAATKKFNDDTAQVRKELFTPPIPDLTHERLREGFRQSADVYRRQGKRQVADALQKTAESGRLPREASDVIATGFHAQDEKGQTISRQVVPGLILPDNTTSTGNLLVVLRPLELIYRKDGPVSKDYGDLFDGEKGLQPGDKTPVKADANKPQSELVINLGFERNGLGSATSVSPVMLQKSRIVQASDFRAYLEKERLALTRQHGDAAAATTTIRLNVDRDVQFDAVTALMKLCQEVGFQKITLRLADEAVEKYVLEILRTPFNFDPAKGSWQGGAYEMQVLMSLNMVQPRDRAVKTLLKVVDRSEKGTMDQRRLAMMSLGELAPQQVIPLLIKELEGAKNIPVEKFKESFPYHEISVLEQIGEEAKEAIPVLIKILDTPDGLACQSALFALIKIGPSSDEVMNAIAARFGKPEESVWSRAVYEVGRYGKQAKPLGPTFVKLLSAKPKEARIWAAQALVKSGFDEARGFDELMKDVTAGESADRGLAALALAALGSQAKPMIPKLRAFENDPDAHVAKEVRDAIRRIEKDDRIFTHAEEAAKTAAARKAATEALKQISAETKAILSNEEYQRFEGTWRISLRTIDRAVSLGEFGKDGKHVIKDRQMGDARISLDPSKTPREIDLTFTSGPDKGKVLRGIYEWVDDAKSGKLLRISVGTNLHQPGDKDARRPKDFEERSAIDFAIWERIVAGNPKSANAASKEDEPGFSETSEVVLSMGSLKFMLDLDTGKTMDPPQTIRPEQEQMDLQTDQVQPYHYPTKLTGRGLVGVEVKSSDWDASAADVRRALTGRSVEPLKEMDLGPEKNPTYFFRTKAGAQGVLQLLGIMEEPKGIRLRYKTVAVGTGTLPTQSSARPTEPTMKEQVVDEAASLPRSEQEKAVAKLVLVFFQDKSRRAIPCLVLNVGDKTFVISAGPAGIVPDGTAHAVDRAFLELPGKPPVQVEFDPRSTKEFSVYRLKENLHALQLKDTARVEVEDRVSAVGISSPTPKQATVVALDRPAELDLRDRNIKHQYEKLIEVDRSFPEGTPFYKDGNLVGLTLLGSRFIGEQENKSYIVRTERIVELCARIEQGVAESPPKSTTAAPNWARHLGTVAGLKSIAYSPDGKLIAVANGNVSFPVAEGWKRAVVILDAETGKTVLSLPLATKEENEILAATEGLPHFEVGPMAFSPDAGLLAVGTGLGQVKLINPKTGELIRSLDDEPAKLAEKTTPEKLKSLKRAMGGVGSLAFSPDGTLLVTTGSSFEDAARNWGDVRRLGRLATGPGRLKVWDVKTGALKHDLAGHSHAFAAAFSADGSLLVSTGRGLGEGVTDNGVITWNPQTGEKLRSIAIEANGGTHALVFSPTKKLVAVASRMFDKENDTSSTSIRLLYPLSGITEWDRNFPGWASPKAFLPDGSGVGVLCGGDSIKFLSVETAADLFEIHPTDAKAKSSWIDFALAPQARKLAIGGTDKEHIGSVEIWDLGSAGTGKPPAPLQETEKK